MQPSKFEVEYNGWALIIFMISVGIWAYQARRENEFIAGSVYADNRIDALNKIKEEF